MHRRSFLAAVPALAIAPAMLLGHTSQPQDAGHVVWRGSEDAREYLTLRDGRFRMTRARSQAHYFANEAEASAMVALLSGESRL